MRSTYEVPLRNPRNRSPGRGGVSRTAVEGLLPHISDGARLDELAKAVQIGPAPREAVTHRPTAVLPPAAPLRASVPSTTVPVRVSTSTEISPVCYSPLQSLLFPYHNFSTRFSISRLQSSPLLAELLFVSFLFLIRYAKTAPPPVLPLPFSAAKHSDHSMIETPSQSFMKDIGLGISASSSLNDHSETDTVSVGTSVATFYQ